MSAQPLRGSIYDAYASIGKTLELILSMDDLDMMKGSIKGLIEHCNKNATPKKKNRKNTPPSINP